MSKGEQNAVPVLLYLFHQIERRLRGEPSLLILEEAWLLLNHPVFSTKIEEWLRVLRKRNCAVVFVSQSLTEVYNSPQRDLLLESCPTKVFLPNPEARNSPDGAALPAARPERDAGRAHRSRDSQAPLLLRLASSAAGCSTSRSDPRR